MAIKCERKELTEVLTISEVVRTPDGQGGFTQAITALAGMPIYARVRAKRGQEVNAQGGVRPQAEYEVTVRARSGIVAGQHCAWRGITYRVAPPVADSWRDRWLVFTITSGVAL